MKLVASAIVRNEAERYLDVWLHHLLSYCDGVVLLDDGSTDATREIASSYPEVDLHRNTGPSFLEHESEARNQLLHHTMRSGTEYVLSIDADEFIGDGIALREALHDGAPVYAVTMREVWKVDEGQDTLALRVDGLWGDRRTHILWRSPGRPRGQMWRIPRRRLACGREPLTVRRSHAVDAGLAVYHFGWTRERDRQARAERYFEHDRGRYHADRHLQSILWPDDQVELAWVPWPPSVPWEAGRRALLE